VCKPKCSTSRRRPGLSLSGEAESGDGEALADQLAESGVLFKGTFGCFLGFCAAKAKFPSYPDILRASVRLDDNGEVVVEDLDD
jgi:hypothetical protein